MRESIQKTTWDELDALRIGLYDGFKRFERHRVKERMQHRQSFLELGLCCGSARGWELHGAEFRGTRLSMGEFFVLTKGGAGWIANVRFFPFPEATPTRLRPTGSTSCGPALIPNCS